MTDPPGGSSQPHDPHRGAAPLLRRTSTLRGVFFVAANLIGFLAVTAFSRYLATGRWLEFSVAGYREALATPLTELMVRPLSIYTHPWMTVVAGLLVSAVIFVPIMVAVLYRLWVSAMFVLGVAVVGHAPLLAAFLAVGCVLAGRTRLRSHFPFLALLVGLAPLAVYLGFFARSGELLLTPLQWFVLYMVLILAAVVAMLAGGVVLALARLTRFRPGVIWPVLLVFLGLPLAVFYSRVGPAELGYALIAGQLQPADGLFRSETLGAFLQLRPSLNSSADSPEAMLQAVERELDRRRRRLMGWCESFLQDYPDSARGPAVLWILAVAQDVQIDPTAFREGLVKYDTHSPSKLSLRHWSRLTDRFGRSPQGMVAHQRLGIEALRDGRVQKAIEDIHIAKLLTTYLSGGLGTSESLWVEVFVPLESLPGEDYYSEVLAQTETIIWLISENKVIEGGQENVNAFADYMKLWPFKHVAAHALAELAGSSKQTELEDNYALVAAMSAQDPLTRAVELSALTTGLKDAAITAHYELGRLALRYGDSPDWDIRQLKSAEHYFGVVQRSRENPYKRSAEQHLARLAAKKPPAP